MKYKIKLKDKELSELIVDLEEEEIEKISQALQRKETKMIRLGERFINTTYIMMIEPAEKEVISQEFRLPEPKPKEEKRIRVSGSWQLSSVRERIKKLFYELKKRGCYKQYPTYEDWEKETYKDDIERIKAIEKNEFRETLLSREKKQYDYMFGD